MRHTTLCVATIALAALAFAAPCEAQRSPERAIAAARNGKQTTADHRPSGFMLGVRSVGALGLSMPMEQGEGNYNTKFGAGAGVMIGYGINETFSVFTSLDIAKQNSDANEAIEGNWGLVDMEIGARANLPLGGVRTVPYVTGSFGRRALAARATDEDGESFDASISGKAFGVGAGLEHAFSRTMSLDAGVDVGFGKFDQLKAGDDQVTQNVSGTRSIRMRLGVTWRPGARGTT